MNTIKGKSSFKPKTFTTKLKPEVVQEDNV